MTDITNKYLIQQLYPDIELSETEQNFCDRLIDMTRMVDGCFYIPLSVFHDRFHVSEHVGERLFKKLKAEGIIVNWYRSSYYWDYLHILEKTCPKRIWWVPAR